MVLVYHKEITVRLFSINVTQKHQLDVKIKDVMLLDLIVMLSKDAHKNYKDVKMDHVYLIYKTAQVLHVHLT